MTLERYRVRLIFNDVAESKRTEFEAVTGEVPTRVLRSSELTDGLAEAELELLAVGPVEALLTALKYTMYAEIRLGASGTSAEVLTLHEWERRRAGQLST